MSVERERERVRREERINTGITSFGENPQEKIRYYKVEGARWDAEPIKTLYDRVFEANPLIGSEVPFA